MDYTYTILILLLPFLSFLFLGLAGKWLSHRAAGLFGTTVLGVVTVLSYYTAFTYFTADRVDGVFQTLVPVNFVWLPFSDALHFDLGIMLDEETGLYFRDGKYVYPKHKTEAGKKDFWARGDGWVLAGLAKVLQDMPETYVRQPFFVEKFTNLARGVKKLQQPQGHWTRSMMDPEQAPGYETSGTAFFCYGLLWGVNNGYLSKKEFAPTIKKAWNYLTTIALQNNGRIGYVQPIGERAIPGQTVDANSQANFGVGAFLLAACEYVKYISR